MRRRGVALALLLATVALALRDVGAPAPAAATVLPVPASSDALLVQPRAGVSLTALAAALTASGHTLDPGTEASGALRVRVPPGADPAALAAVLAGSGLARGVEPDALVRAAIEPNDRAYARQSDYLEAIRAPAAWDRATGDGATLIAIVDSGLDYDHPEFRGRIAINRDERFGYERDDDRNGCVDDVGGCNFVSPLSADPSCHYVQAAPNWRAWDDAGHGTVVAGVVWDARLLPVKVLDCTGVGRISTAAVGIRYAAARGAHVINISLGTTSDSAVLREAVEHAQRSGALIVASAGNVPGVVTYPGAYDGVIGASGVLSDGAIDFTRAAPFSGSGPAVDLFAPGRLIAGPVPPALCGRAGWQCEDGPYTRVSGSSFAGALVTGAGAGLLDLAAALDAPRYRAAVPGTARTSGGPPAASGSRPGS